jgi:hypothetical protein
VLCVPGRRKASPSCGGSSKLMNNQTLGLLIVLFLALLILG